MALTKVTKVKRTAAKRTARKPRKVNVKRAYDSKSIVGKLLKLKYRINDTATTEGGWSTDMSDDKNYVMSLIQDIRKHNFKKLAREDGHCCNSLWRKYAR